MRKAVLLAALIPVGLSPAAAQRVTNPVPAYNRPPAPVLPARAGPGYSRLVAELRALRAEALALRERDGGRLTAAHSDLIQARLDAAWQRYRDASRRQGARAGG